MADGLRSSGLIVTPSRFPCTALRILAFVPSTSTLALAQPRDWIKVKTATWRAANRYRWERFERNRRTQKL